MQVLVLVWHSKRHLLQLFFLSDLEQIVLVQAEELPTIMIIPSVML